MKKFRDILVYTQPDTRQQYALSDAVDLARHLQAKLTVIDVIQGYTRIEERDDLPDAVTIALEQESQERLSGLIEPIQAEGIEVETKVLWGKPALEIIRQVIQYDYDLVLKTAEGKQAFRNLLFGTTAMQLFRKCPCPVWAVKPDIDRSIDRIAVAVDLLHDKDSPGLNKRLLELSYSLSQFYDCELHIIHVWHAYGEEALKHRLNKAKINDLIEETGDSRKEMFDKLLSTLESLDHIQAHLLHGDVNQIIPQFVLDKNIDLMVLGSVGRSGVAGLFIGNTAERLLNSADCSVLAIKPEGFQSPVHV